MKLYITVNSSVEYFEIHIFQRYRKGRIPITYNAEKIKKFNLRLTDFYYEESVEAATVNICKWLAVYEAGTFMGTIGYIDPGMMAALIISKKSGVEHFLKEWI